MDIEPFSMSISLQTGDEDGYRNLLEKGKPFWTSGCFVMCWRVIQQVLRLVLMVTKYCVVERSHRMRYSLVYNEINFTHTIFVLNAMPKNLP